MKIDKDSPLLTPYERNQMRSIARRLRSAYDNAANNFPNHIAKQSMKHSDQHPVKATYLREADHDSQSLLAGRFASADHDGCTMMKNAGDPPGSAGLCRPL